MGLKIAIQYSPWLLSHRGGTLELDGYRQDPRGLSGSELAAIRLSEEFAALGHEVELHTVSPKDHGKTLNGVKVVDWSQRYMSEHYDVALNVNTPNDLEQVKAKFRVVFQLLNDFTYCQPGFDSYTDLYISPSEPHRQMILGRAHQTQGGFYSADEKAWKVIQLGCDPDRYGGDKVRGRVVHCSSPDRGLHILLMHWPAIRKAVPWATLKIFYRLQPWIDGFKTTDYWPPIEELRARSLYVEEALRRLKGHGVEVCDAVSREQIEREMSQAEVLAYPCDPTNHFTEGWSCSTLEGCAAQACPVISDADALGEIYSEACMVVERGDWLHWRNCVIDMLTKSECREVMNASAVKFAKQHTWRKTAERFDALIKERLK